MIDTPKISKEIKQKVKKTEQVSKMQVPHVEHHSGKGTRSRLNTAAEKKMFNSRYSK